jgi:hypothetical protein
MPKQQPSPQAMDDAQLKVVDHAITVAEDVISDRFHLTMAAWKKYRYDIRGLKDLRPEEILADVFAQIVRYGRPAPPDGLRMGDFYRICLMDHNILAALNRDDRLELYPLMVYIITHELIHIVRFYTFKQFFHAQPEEREAEETRVHQLTFDVLRKAHPAGMNPIFEFYAEHRREGAIL